MVAADDSILRNEGPYCQPPPIDIGVLGIPYIIYNPGEKIFSIVTLGWALLIVSLNLKLVNAPRSITEAKIEYELLHFLPNG
jgi:hypothetical protein